MDINEFRKLAFDIDQFKPSEIENFELMNQNELSRYQYELEIDSGNLSDWDHIRNLFTLKYKIQQLEETIRIYKVVDEYVKEQSKKVKHLFPLENTAGYGQLVDKVLELENKSKEN